MLNETSESHPCLHPPTIARLPVEIIREMMIQSSRIPEVYDSTYPKRSREGETAMFLSQVCAHWRSIALDMRELWSTIPLVTLRAHWTELALKRSYPVPITVNIDLDDLYCVHHPRWYRQCVSKVFPHLWRASTLSLSGLQDNPHDDAEDDIDSAWYWQKRLSDEILDALNTATPQFLQSLKLYTVEKGERELRNEVFSGQHPPKLHELRLYNVYWQHPFSSPILHPSLTLLEIRGDIGTSLAESLMPMLELLRWLPGLQILIIDRSTSGKLGGPADSNPSKVVLPHLRQLQVSDLLDNVIDFCHRLILPQGVDFYLSVPFMNPEHDHLVAQSARIVAELGHIYRAQASTALACGIAYTTLDVTHFPIGPLDVGTPADLHFTLYHSTDPATASANATLPQPLHFTLWQWGFRNIRKVDPGAPLPVPISSVLGVLPALEHVLEMNVESGIAGFDLAEEWMGVSGALKNVEKISVKSSAARGFVMALLQTAQSSSSFFPSLRVLTIENLASFDAIGEESSEVASSGDPFDSLHRLPSISIQSIFTVLLEALQLRVTSGQPLRLRVRRCFPTTDVVNLLGGCLGTDELDWDGELDGARKL
ncbi:hypothetical protein BV25DRAFT_1986781 [Artomyces pyxidatus]|uniref:Uncharacterized protein n=1 Tax=Artomyces pyxidatus TaxID=48021 RepID=A0ACB8TLL9_9AGAM|nr:hypothetical protein BV25DRAFT_1986781 [Artomyces pyxidatus]